MLRLGTMLQWLCVGLLAAALLGCPASQQPAQAPPTDPAVDHTPRSTPPPEEAPADPVAAADAEDAAADPEPEAEPIAQLDGAELFASANCTMCHGADLAGKGRMGPPLANLAQHWDSAAELAKYLAAPGDYAAGNPRLQQQSGNYSMMMPPAPLAEDEQLALAAWLLEQ